MTDEKIKSFLKVIARRKNMQKWLVYISWCLLVTASLAFIINTIAIFVPIYNATLYGCIIILSGFLLSFVYLIIKHTNMYEAARYADSAGLKERLVTSIEFIGSEDGFAKLLKEDTVDEISRFDKKLRLPLNYPWKRYIVCAILVCMFVICIFVPSQARKEAKAVHKLAMQAKEAEKKAEDAMELLDKAEANGVEDAEAKKLKKILEDAKKELAEASNESDIKKAEERLKSKLKQELAEADNNELLKAFQPLVPDTNLAKMADFNKNLADIAQKSGIDKDLVNELKNVAESLTPEQMEKLIEELKKAMENGEVTASEVAAALSGIGNRDAQMAAATITAASGNNGSQGNTQASSATSSATPSTSNSNSNNSSNPSSSGAPGGGSGSGNGSGQGNGNGSGQGSGNGSGSGQGNGSGSGNGPGWNMGNSEGLERKEQEGKGEAIYLTGKEQGSDDNLTGKKNGEATITEKSDQMGGALSGSKAELDTVIGDYSSEAYAKVDSNKVPSAMKDIVKEYFSGFNE